MNVNLVQLTHSSGASITAIASSGLYLCGGDRCTHWVGQPALAGVGGVPDMYCRLVGYAPETTCQAEYLDQAVTLDSVRRDLWQRLDDATALEQRRQLASAAAARLAVG